MASVDELGFAELNGGPGNDVLIDGDTAGHGGDDSVSASPGVGALTQLSFDGGSGSDVLNGTDGPDLLVGGSGNDRITPGSGRDVVFAGGGDDQVDLRDGAADFASGGDGADTVITEAADVVDGFEIVNAPAPPAPEPPPVVAPPPVVQPVVAMASASSRNVALLLKR